MRAHGSLDTVPGADTTDHVCWVCAEDDDAGFGEAVRTFLAGGLARGERLLCVGERVVDSVRADMAPFTGVDALAEAGTLELMAVADAYDATGEFAAERQLVVLRRRHPPGAGRGLHGSAGRRRA